MTPRPQVSAAAERIYARLAPYQDGDDAQWALLHLCEAAAITLRKPTEMLRHDDAGSGSRRMWDPARAPAFALTRMRQAVGLERFPTSTSETQQRATIAAAPRWRRCTPPALRTALLPLLAGQRRVRIVPRVDDNRWHDAIVLYRADVPAENESLIAQVVRQHKQTRKRLTLVIVDGWTLGEFEAAFDTLADAEAAFSTLQDLERNEP